MPQWLILGQQQQNWIITLSVIFFSVQALIPELWEKKIMLDGWFPETFYRI